MTPTGRWAGRMSGPEWQDFRRRKPNPDYELIGLDFADLELRVFAHLHERTMTDFNYANLAQRTCPDSYHVTAVPPGLLMQTMMAAINALAALDAVKKAYAYGKPLPATLKPVADAAADIRFAGELDGHILHSILGTATEGGELLEAAMKTLFNGEPFDIVNFQEELGDIAWYRAIGLNAVGQTIDANDRQNIEKLLARFPDKFDAGLAINRDTDAERKVLERRPMELQVIEVIDVPHVEELNAPGIVLRGRIYNDIRDRFADGEIVRTSYVTAVNVEQKTIHTRNSIYRHHELGLGLDVLFHKLARVNEPEVVDTDDHAEDLQDVEIIAHGPDHNRLRWTDEDGEIRLSGRIVLMPFRAGDEYNGKYKGQLLATDEAILYRINGDVTDNSAYVAEPVEPSNGISRV